MTTRMRHTQRLAVCLVLLAFVCSAVPAAVLAQEPRVGTVDLNRALNLSEAGKRSKQILLTAKDQKQKELEARESALQEKVQALRNNLILTEEARTKREQELREEQSGLRREVQRAQQDLLEREKKLTEAILVELRTVVAEVSREKKLDYVLEIAAARTILYSKIQFQDITEEIIQRYNSFQGK